MNEKKGRPPSPSGTPPAKKPSLPPRPSSPRTAGNIITGEQEQPGTARAPKEVSGRRKIVDALDLGLVWYDNAPATSKTMADLDSEGKACMNHMYDAMCQAASRQILPADPERSLDYFYSTRRKTSDDKFAPIAAEILATAPEQSEIARTVREIISRMERLYIRLLL